MPSPFYSRPLAGQCCPPSPSAPPFIPRTIIQPPGSFSRPPRPPSNQSTMAKPSWLPIQTHLNGLHTAPASPLTWYGKTPTGRLPAAYGCTPDCAGLHQFPSRPLPTPSSGHLHQPHPPTCHLTTSHPSKNPPHHRTRPSTTSCHGLCSTAVHALVNDLRSCWTPPPTWSLGPHWIPPLTQPPPPSPPPTPSTGPPLLCFVVDLTQPVYRKVFLSPGTKGFPPDRTWFITKPHLPSSHTFSRDSGYVAYSGPPPAFGTTPPNPKTVPGGILKALQ